MKAIEITKIINKKKSLESGDCSRTQAENGVSLHEKDTHVYNNCSKINSRAIKKIFKKQLSNLQLHMIKVRNQLSNRTTYSHIISARFLDLVSRKQCV